jgi:hypothetical protein
MRCWRVNQVVMSKYGLPNLFQDWLSLGLHIIFNKDA